MPRVTEEKKPVAYWRWLNDWLNGGGLATIRSWAEKFLEANPDAVVEPGEEAPITDAKKELIAESRSQGEDLADNLAQAAMGQPNLVFLLREVREWVARRMGKDVDKVESEHRLRVAMLDAGMKEPPKRGQDNRLKVRGINERIVASFPLEETDTWGKIEQHHKKPDDVCPM